MIESLLSKTLEKLFDEEEFKDCFLVDVVIGPKEKVEIYIDADDSLTLGRCQKVSRFVESEIESKGWLGEKYTLEVSSPGLDRPLKFLRQYRKNIGRTLKISPKEGKKFEGILTEVNEEGIQLQVKNVSQKVPFEQIDKAQVMVSFK